ncbi:MAG: hypothetical protein HQL84_07375 [Magnetococcales bacterium]|nr:hypothetical protein [Magnetococcales bacterium]MBF0149851.1 hypothetical protein [Magnetococcales bacterium]MBF0173667.1 hypothetical protein [Magnetococcales bacterium]MBF0346588.1 hypothetical protein [Magnetococcales bacterium]MBF0631147.1 hypothetical protein [Magnetococcales bacterium]
MASSIDAISGDAMQAMLSAYRKTGDVTGAGRQAQAVEVERTETSEEREVRKGKNDAAVTVTISPEARQEYENSTAQSGATQPPQDTATQASQDVPTPSPRSTGR